jgi:hypothetical protein
MGDENKGPAAELTYRLEDEPRFDGEKLEGSYYLGYSREGLQAAIEAAINKANKEPGTTFVVSQIEVVSEGDPHVGGYKVVLSQTGG